MGNHQLIEFTDETPQKFEKNKKIANLVAKHLLRSSAKNRLGITSTHFREDAKKRQFFEKIGQF